MSLGIWSTHQNWVCHCIIRLDFQSLYISRPKRESGTEKPSIPHCHSHLFQCSAFPASPWLAPVSWALPWALLSKAAWRRSSSPYSPSCPRWREQPSPTPPRVIQQDSHSPPEHTERGHERVRRSAWKRAWVCSGLARPRPTVAMKAYSILPIVERDFQRKALSKPQTFVNSNRFPSACF